MNEVRLLLNHSTRHQATTTVTQSSSPVRFKKAQLKRSQNHNERAFFILRLNHPEGH